MVAPISVMNVSQYKREYGNFHLLKENGFGPDIYLFVHFIEPAFVIIDGIRYVTQRNACIFYSPGVRQEYGHVNGTFLNSFIVLKTTDPYLLVRYGLPQNEIFYIQNIEKINFLLELVVYTITDKLVNREEETQQHLQNFLEILSEQCNENDIFRKRRFEVKLRFIAMRDEVIKAPKGWTVEKMAKRVWYTRSRFSVIYSQFFGKSAVADLIEIKISHAKKLLETTDMTIANIATECGYSSLEHFIRIFSKHVHTAPLQYRKTFLRKLNLTAMI